jgi:simple sugar transport system ATP-binding protein
VALAGSSAFGGVTTATGGAATPDAAHSAPLTVANLVVRDERGQVVVDGVSFDVAPGEILGIAGVEGNGQTELIEAIAGLRPTESGRILLTGRDFDGLSVKQRGDAGLSHIPEDRHERGLVLDYSIAENLVLGQQHHFTTRGMLDRQMLADNAARQISAYDIRPTDAAVAARSLSGGNQQKIVIAREMTRDFMVLLASQPTRGVDVGAIEFIHAQLRKARDAGKAILLVSADLTEILALSDRIAVMYEGTFATVMPRSGANEEVLGPYMTGAAESAA